MKALKLEEKDYFDNCSITAMQGLLSGEWFNPNSQKEGNFEQIADWSILFAKTMLQKRQEYMQELASNKKSNSNSNDINSNVTNIDFEEILEIFKTVCVDNPKPHKLTSERKKAILKILQIHTLEDIGSVIKKTAESDWLTGKTIVKGKPSWKVTFDWIIEPENFIKILEDSYKNGNTETSKTNGEIFATAMQSEMGNNFKFK